MKLTETQFKNWTKHKIKKEFPNAFIYKSCDKFTSGIPDLLCCIDGKFVAIELKVGRNMPTFIQLAIIKIINNAGGLACWVNSKKELINFLTKIKEKKK